MRWALLVLATGLFAVSGAGCSSSSSCCEPASAQAPAANAKYKCSMDGGTRETPGACPKCGMALPEKK